MWLWSHYILFEPVTIYGNISIEMDDTERSESSTWMVIKIETPVCIRDIDCRLERRMK